MIKKFFEFKDSGHTDDELVRMIVSGISVEESKRILFERYKGSILSFLKKKTHKLSEDEFHTILHDTFVRAFSKIEKYSGPNKFGQWLSSVSYRVFLSYIESKNPPTVEIPETWDIRDISSEKSLEQREMSNIIDQFSESLTEKEKNWLRLFRMGMTHSQISKEIGIDEGTSKYYKSNITSLLKEWIQGKIKRRTNSKRKIS
jgi:RNA polymerase sigma factor (sigma-70 family)